jgi:hypothetical protein
MKEVYFRTIISGKIEIEDTGDDQSEVSEVLLNMMTDNRFGVIDSQIIDVKIVK